MNDFYTYAYLREDGTPYYIGKGRGRRVHNPHLVFVPPEERILFLKINLTEEEAFKHEIYMIAVLGRKDKGAGILRNLTDGGDGSTGYVFTEQGRNNVSKGKLGKKRKPFTDEHRKRISRGKRGRKLNIQNENRSQRVSESNKGKKWFVNSSGERRFSHDYPGEGWQRGKTWKEQT